MTPFPSPPARARAQGNSEISRPFATLLASVLKGANVVDLGAGLGQYEKYFDEGGHAGELRDPATRPASIRACDGAENIEDFAFKNAAGVPYVSFCDLTSPGVDLGGPPSDWAMSIEVGEHIAAGAHEAAYLGNLAAHGRVGIVCSWATPEQAGHHHVNGRSEPDVIATFAKLGYEYDKATSEKLRDASTLHWLQKTTFVFRKPGAVVAAAAATAPGAQVKI